MSNVFIQKLLNGWPGSSTSSGDLAISAAREGYKLFMKTLVMKFYILPQKVSGTFVPTNYRVFLMRINGKENCDGWTMENIWGTTSPTLVNFMRRNQLLKTGAEVLWTKTFKCIDSSRNGPIYYKKVVRINKTSSWYDNGVDSFNWGKLLLCVQSDTYSNYASGDQPQMEVAWEITASDVGGANLEIPVTV